MQVSFPPSELVGCRPRWSAYWELLCLYPKGPGPRKARQQPAEKWRNLVNVFRRFIAVLFFQLERLKTLRTESSVYADVTLDEYLGKRKAGYL